MSLTGWDADKKLTLTIDADDIDSALTDFPVLVNLGISVGKDSFDASAVFEELQANNKKIAIEQGDTGNQCYCEIERWHDGSIAASKGTADKTHDLGGDDDGNSDLTDYGTPEDNDTYYTFNGSNNGLTRATDLGDSSDEVCFATVRIHDKGKGTAQIIWKDGGYSNGVGMGIDASGNLGIFGRAADAFSSITIPSTDYENDVWYDIYFTKTKVVILLAGTSTVVASVAGSCSAADGGGYESLGMCGYQSPISGSSGSNIEFFDGDINVVEIYPVADLTAPTAGTFTPAEYYGNGTSSMITASSTLSGYAATKAFDGNASSSNSERWISNTGSMNATTGLPTTSVYLDWDFGELAEVITSIRFFHNNYSVDHNIIKKFDVFVSDTGDFTGEEIDLGEYSTDNATGNTWGQWNDITVPTGGRYLRIDILEMYVNQAGTTHVECAEVEFKFISDVSAQLHVKIPSVSASADTVLNLYYDSTQDDNPYIGDTGDTASDIFTVFTHSSNGTFFADMSWRFILASAQVTAGNLLRVVFEHGGTDYPIDKCYIGIQASSGDDWDFESTPTQVTFDGGSDGTTITSSNLKSDIIEYEIDGTEDIVIAVLSTGATLRPYNTNPTGLSPKYKNSATDETDTLDVSGYSDSANGRMFAGIENVTPNQEVWDDDFVAVYHMSQDPSGAGACMLDSTSNENHGTPAGTMLTGDLVDGEIGKAIEFDGTDDYISCPAVVDAGDNTIEIVAVPLASMSLHGFFTTGDAPTDNAPYFMLQWNSGSLRTYSTTGAYSTIGTYTLDDPYHITIRNNTGTGYYDVNNGLYSGTRTMGLTGDATQCYIGSGYSGYATVRISEVRISDGLRSDVWVETTYLSNTDALITFATATSGHYLSASFDGVSNTSDIVPTGVDHNLLASFDGVSDTSDIDVEINNYLSASFGGVSNTSDIFPTGMHNYLSASFGGVSDTSDIDVKIHKYLSASFDGVSNVPDIDLVLGVFALFEEPYGVEVSAHFVEPYGDVSIITAVFEEYYGDANLLVQRFVEPYGDARGIVRSFEEPYNILSNPMAVFIEPYAITSSEVLAIFEEPYSLEVRNFVQASFQEPYDLLDEGSEVVTDDTTTAIVNSGSGDSGDGGQPGTGQGGTILRTLDFISININAAMGQFCITCEIEIPNAEQYAYCGYLDDMTVTLGGTEFTFFVDARERTITNNAVSYSIGLLSPTAKLDAPYSSTIVDNLDAGTDAEALVVQMAALQNITVDWQILDWTIPGYAISINDETPLTVIKKVVNSVGAIVQTKPNGDMLIISKYPNAVPTWSGLTPIVTLNTMTDINSLSESLDLRDGYNAFQITNQGSSSESISIESVDINGLTKYVHGYRVPFSEGEFPLETSGEPGITIDKYIHPVEVQIPIRETADDPEWEVIEFIDYTGSTAKPIYEVVDYEWITEDLGNVGDLGAFQVSEDGTLSVINTSAVPSESLLRIKYITKYWQWTVSGPTDRPVQFYVPEIEEVS